MSEQEQEESGQAGVIAKVHEDGDDLTLEDGSVWEVPNPGDALQVALWRRGQRVSVVERQDETEDVSDHIHVDYLPGEVTITNLDTRTPETVRVLPHESD